MRFLILFVSTTLAVAAQSFSIGIEAGIPLSPLMAAGQGYHTSTPRYTLGPAIDVGLTRRFAAGASLLYKRFEYSASGAGSEQTSRWELPILLKYRFPGLILHPFAGLGVSFNRVNGAPRLLELRHRTTNGVVGSLGASTRLGPLRFRPEIRLTRWTDRNFGVSDAPLHSNLTQVEFLVAFAF